MQSGACDVRYILSPEQEIDGRPINSAVSGLTRQPQHRVSDTALCALGSNLADTFLHFLQAFADNADDVDGDWRIDGHEIEQLGLAPACFEGLGQCDSVGRIT